MAINDRRDELSEDDLGGQSCTQGEIIIPIIEALSWWKRLCRWKRGESTGAPEAKSWTQQKEEENAKRAQEATAEACGETEEQLKVRGNQ
jgi:hypothetical protein